MPLDPQTVQWDAPAADGVQWDDQKDLSWGEVGTGALKNAIPSTFNLVKGVAGAVAHPVDTVTSLGKLVVGAGENAMEKFAGMVNPDLVRFNNQINGQSESQKVANAVGGFYGDRYGSMEGFKRALATDPAGIAADAATALTGAGALTSKVPGLVGVGEGMFKAGQAVDPLLQSYKAAKVAIPAVGRGVANIIGGIGTHTGGESLKQAARAGMEGGADQASLIANMRGNAPMTDVLDAAKENLRVMAADKAAAYRQGMAQVSSDKSILDFTGIDKAVSDASGISSFKGQVKNTQAAKVTQEIADAVAEWKALNPAEFHTPEGLDALKQRIGGIVEGIPFEQKTAGVAGNKIYNAVKDEITKQAPVYADTMKGYSEASDQIKEIERALSQGKRASADASMRKLQSLMRNNANTNYGNRLDLAKQMIDQGGNNIMPALAGQALNTWTPRGLGSAVAGGLGGGAMIAGASVPASIAAAVPVLAVQSPRLMGEAALKTGQAARLAKLMQDVPANLVRRAGGNPSTAGNVLAQASQPDRQQKNRLSGLLRR